MANDGRRQRMLASTAAETKPATDESAVTAAETKPNKDERRESAMTLLLKNLVITPEELYESGLMKISRNSIYESIQAKELEVIRRGRKILILTAPLRRKLGLEF